MNLYLYSEYTKEVTNITLKDGCYPCIGDQVSDQLEPAIWFKVLVLDAISIDCNKRIVLWHTSTELQKLRDDSASLEAITRTSSKDSDSSKAIIDETNEQNCDIKLACHAESRHSLTRRSSQRIVHRRISESVYAGGECMGYSGDMDEVFEFAHTILSELASGDISQNEFNKQVFRLLHIHVLPNINLSADDILNVQDALAIISSYVDDIDMLIDEKQSLIDRVYRDMRKQRTKFIKEMGAPNFQVTSYSIHFAKLLLSQLTEDIRVAHEEIEDLTQKVEAAKDGMINTAGSNVELSASSNDDELLKIRSQRDQFVTEYFNNLLTARATLEEYTSRVLDSIERRDSRGSIFVKPSKSKLEKEKEKEYKKSKKKNNYTPQKEVNPLYATYMGMEQTCHDILPDILKLADRKVLLLSVKETIRGVLETILSGKETSGVDIAPRGTRRPTDVLRHSQIPIEWLSLPEQVTSLIENSQLPIKQTHRLFCDMVKKKCKDALDSRKLSIISENIKDDVLPDLSPTQNGGVYTQNKLYSMCHTDSCGRSSGISSSMSDTNSSRSYNPRITTSISVHSCSSSELLSSQEVPENVVAFDDSIDSNLNFMNTDIYIDFVNNELETTVTWIKDELNVKFEEICGDLQQHLGGLGQTNFRKIWQCYETHFYPETIDVISKLYQELHGIKIRNVFDNLPFMTACDLDLSGFILDILEDVEIISHLNFYHNKSRESTSSHVTEVSATPSGTICAESSKSSQGSTETPNSDFSGDASAEESESIDSKSVGKEHGLISSQNSDANKNSDTRDKSHGEQNETISPKTIFENIILDGLKLDECEEMQEDMVLTEEKTEESTVTRPSSFLADQFCSGLSIEAHTSSSDSLTGRSSLGSRSATLSSSDGLEMFSSSPDLADTETIKEAETERPMIKSFIQLSQPMLTKLTVEKPATSHQECAEEYRVLPMSPMTMSRAKSTQFKLEYRGRFTQAFSMVDQALLDTSPLFKLQSLCKCLKELGNIYEKLQLELCGKSSKTCTDDLIDILALFLCNFQVDRAQTLYAHIMMLSDLMPRFFAGGQFSFTLVQFFAAFQVLKERNLMKTKKIESESFV